jgi:hypothetical protein
VAPAVGQLEPLPGVAYTPTMQSSDIYPAVMGIGGIRTQDYTIPVFAEGIVAAHQSALGTAALPAGLFNSPAGWMIVLLAALAGLVLYHAEKR